MCQGCWTQLVGQQEPIQRKLAQELVQKLLLTHRSQSLPDLMTSLIWHNSKTHDFLSRKEPITNMEHRAAEALAPASLLSIDAFYCMCQAPINKTACSKFGNFYASCKVSPQGSGPISSILLHFHRLWQLKSLNRQSVTGTWNCTAECCICSELT